MPGSSDEVASSSTSTSGSARAARASDTSCFSPADSREPRSRTGVSSPSGSAANRSSAPHGVEGGVDLGVGGVAAADAHVVADRPGEQEALLGHDAHVPAQVGEGDVAEVDAADAHRAVGRVVEPGHELGHRRLAGAGRADDGQPLARLDPQRHVVEHERAVAVAERRAVELDGAAGGQRHRRPPARRPSGSVSSRSKSLCSPAPADCTMLNSWLSWFSGSNRFDSVSTKNVTVPSVIWPSCTSQPPTASVAAVVSTPAPSMTGRYQAEIRTESMWAS